MMQSSLNSFFYGIRPLGSSKFFTSNENVISPPPPVVEEVVIDKNQDDARAKKTAAMQALYLKESEGIREGPPPLPASEIPVVIAPVATPVPIIVPSNPTSDGGGSFGGGGGGGSESSASASEKTLLDKIYPYLGFASVVFLTVGVGLIASATSKES